MYGVLAMMVVPSPNRSPKRFQKSQEEDQATTRGPGSLKGFQESEWVPEVSQEEDQATTRGPRSLKGFQESE